jgi:hypothetical protein
MLRKDRGKLILRVFANLSFFLVGEVRLDVRVEIELKKATVERSRHGRETWPRAVWEDDLNAP